MITVDGRSQVFEEDLFLPDPELLFPLSLLVEADSVVHRAEAILPLVPDEHIFALESPLATLTGQVAEVFIPVRRGDVPPQMLAARISRIALPARAARVRSQL